MKIYTKSGDAGETSLFAGGRVPKNDPRVDAYGTVDELNSYLGLIRTFNLPAPASTWLEAVQNTLFTIGADLATPLDAKPDWLVRLNSDPVKLLEDAIDTMDESLEPLRAFVLPGGVQAAAFTHIARTVCRRAERLCVDLAQSHPINHEVIIYLNRLSDFLFVLARFINYHAGESETKWSVR
ncbi:MAG: ATP:cob(I)alamin adenosyltransferase [Phototrophicales bacterium]|nr:MAG: ATP:cob(I)alamin adenosyltransferase [Phototrophicales bacterium]RMG76569.1 MAG: cob(I)yrinic acid a,c-diamide adenosyltransferase [Chloroflexota bacterium]